MRGTDMALNLTRALEWVTLPVVNNLALAALAALLLLPAAACNRSQAEAPRTGPGAGTAAFRPIAVTVGQAEARRVQRSVETSGSLLAADEVIAKAEQQGTIARLRVDLGDRVAAGAVLAEYDRREFELAVDQAQADVLAAREALARARATVASSEASRRRVRDSQPMLQADVARAESQHEWARLEFERARQLHGKELIAARDVDNARTLQSVAAAQLEMARTTAAQHPDQMRVAEAQVQSDLAAVRAAEAQVRQREAALGMVRKRLGDTTVRAPIAGLVARRHVSAGEFVKDNTPLFTLVVAHPLKYVGSVPERQAPELRAGQAVTLTVDAYGERAFTGAVVRVAPAVDVATRTLVLEARVPNADGALRPGFFAKGHVRVREDPAAVFVPGEAVTSVAGITKVFVVADAKAEERQVRLGARQGTWVEIPAGVKAGETVATSNLPALFNGAPVELPRGR
ncbi:MAG TPA: efflux RND transporter periplasmic adaptor subunit [Methylomirabilota bacterium]|nr:efflux RND transporter periplasmic adaptor subunit [Methylomirabilota bacterium]